MNKPKFSKDEQKFILKIAYLVQKFEISHNYTIGCDLTFWANVDGVPTVENKVSRKFYFNGDIPYFD